MECFRMGLFKSLIKFLEVFIVRGWSFVVFLFMGMMVFFYYGGLLFNFVISK